MSNDKYIRYHICSYLGIITECCVFSYDTQPAGPNWRSDADADERAEEMLKDNR